MAGGGFAAGLIVSLPACMQPTQQFLGSPSLTDPTATHLQPFGVLIAIATTPVMLLVMCVLRVIWAED